MKTATQTLSLTKSELFNNEVFKKAGIDTSCYDNTFYQYRKVDGKIQVKVKKGFTARTNIFTLDLATFNGGEIVANFWAEVIATEASDDYETYQIGFAGLATGDKQGYPEIGDVFNLNCFPLRNLVVKLVEPIQE